MKKTIFILFIILLAPAIGNADARDSREAAKIGYLITSVESMQGAMFFRNGEWFDARAAAKHLRLKLKNAGNRVRTAEDFIGICGSKSYLSGEPYLIRFSDGTTVKTEAFLRNKLAAYPNDRP